MKRTADFRLSFFRFFGVFIVITGVFLMLCAYNGSGMKKINAPENDNSVEDDEDIEDIEAYYYSIKTRSDTAFRISLAVFGGLCIMGGIPAFYVSRSDKIYKLPKRKKSVEIQEPEEEEFNKFDFDSGDVIFFQRCIIPKDDTVNGSEPTAFKSDSDVINHIKRHYKKKDDNK